MSTKEQTENSSLPTQIRACEEYCRREGYEVLERLKEEGESAKTTDRTELLKPSRTTRGVVSQTFASWNQIAGWLRRLAGLRDAA